MKRREFLGALATAPLVAQQEVPVKDKREDPKTPDVKKSEEKKEEPKHLLNLTYFGAELLLGPQYKELAAEYAWESKDGKISGFGFDEKRPEYNFTNHNIRYKPFDKIPVSVMFEGGLDDKKGFAAAGAGFDMNSLPTVDKVFDMATVNYLQRVAGVSPEKQVLFVWDTKDVKLPKIPGSFSSEGFYRFRPGDIKNYSQPQFLIGLDKFKQVKGLVQFDVSGKDVMASVGVKVYIK